MTTDQQPSEAAEKKSSEGESAMKELWAEAAKSFESICGESLQRGGVKTFDDALMQIENGGKAGAADGPDDRWDKAKSVGLASLKYLKLLVGAASQASSFLPVPESAVSITSNALFFVFHIPEAIKGYNDAVNQVFGEVSSALSQFKIYESMNNVDTLLIRQIHLVMTSFVRICAHVVQYRQGRKRDRAWRQIKSIFDDDSGLADEMAEFKRALQQQRDVEGTITLAVVVETRKDIAIMLEKFTDFGKVTEETHQVVQDTQKGVQSLSADAKRIKTLVKIRDTLNVQSTVRLDTRTTQTCSDIYRNCLDGTGSWIWTHPAYTAWTETKDKETPHVLLLSGPASSGKTLASSLITKRLEEQEGRKYVAHYFFPTRTKKSEDEKNPVQSALKYMAFQIARVDGTVLTALGKACDANPSSFRSSSNLESLWGELKIGSPGSGAWYYFILDGLENLPGQQAESLLKFLFSPKMTGESAGRVRFLVSGTDDQFTNVETVGAAQIQIQQHNMADMRIIIDDALNSQGMLKNAKPGSNQQKAKDKIIEKLPQNAKGSYSLLQFGISEVIRLLSTRTAIEELDQMLDQTTSSHEVAIKQLQRSLTMDEISELNELLKWVLFCNEVMYLDELEAAMFLYSGTESLASLQYIIKNKYSAVLKVENTEVYEQDGVKDYLRKERDGIGKSSHSKEQSTISMTITINNVDQELCGHFLWDLAQKAIRDKFRFDFDAAANSMHSRNATIAVDEFEAHHTIITRAFQYLSEEPRDQTKNIGRYLVYWLPYHLSRLRQLEDEEKGALMPNEQFEIGRNLYELFKDDACFKRHQASFQITYWTADEMEDVRKWLMDSAVVRKLDKRWRDKVQLALSPARGYLREFVKMVITGFLRERSWNLENAYDWIAYFMEADDKAQKPPTPLSTSVDNAAAPDSSSSSGSANENSKIDWDRLSTWCQDFLGPDVEPDSLWYERLARAASLKESTADVVLSLYQRALEKQNPSWRCHRGLGVTYFSQYQLPEAVSQVELALQSIEREDATPKPEETDFMDLHLLLGDYAYAANDIQKAADHYSLACQSNDGGQALSGQFGLLKSRLNSSDVDGAKEILKNALAFDGGESRMVGILKMVARTEDHDVIVSKIFSLAKADPGLLKGIVHAMETATMATPAEDRTGQSSEENRFAEDECRGVLLYDRGIAAYKYNVSPEGTEPVNEALRLWKESLDQLSNVGGRNAYAVQQNAIAALAKHYFQHMVDGEHLDHLDALAKLAETESYNVYSDPPGFLGALYALRDKKEQSKAVLIKRIRLALRILLDDTPENDSIGLALLEQTLEQHQDFGNAAIALSLLAVPDLVTDGLHFEIKDIEDEDGLDKAKVIEIVTRLARETVQVAKIQVPSASQQSQRIEAAKTYVDSLVATAESKSKSAADSNGTIEKPGGNNGGEPASIDRDTNTALRLLQSRITGLHKKHVPEIDAAEAENWTCDGRNPAGNRCENRIGFEREFYHCIYCPNVDLCGDCLQRLLDPESKVEITACSDRHRWLRTPRMGEDMYLGPRARRIRGSRKVTPSEGDDRILEIRYADDGEEITVDAWLESVAAEWDISIEELRKEAAMQTTPDGNGEGEVKAE